MSLQGQTTNPEPDAGLRGRLARFAASPRLQTLSQAAPERQTTLLVVLGMVIGMFAAYMVIPAEFTGASPRHMSQQAIQQWVRMVAVGHSQDVHYDGANALLVLRQIPEPQAVVEGLAANANIPAAERQALEALIELDGFNGLDAQSAAAPQDPGLAGSSLQVALAVAAVALGLPILTIAGRSLAGLRTRRGSAPRREAPPPAAAQATAPASAPGATTQYYGENPAARPLIEDETERGGSLHPQYGLPVMRAVSTYVKGQNYDDSFAIELGPEQENQFLGECGISAATRVGQELQAVEFWGFDMAAQETLTKIFTAPAALTEPAMLATLAERVKDPANDIVAAEPGAFLVVESSAILIQAEIKSVICNYGGGRPNSDIESLQIELLAWHKQNQRADASASGNRAPADSPFAEYADMQFVPPAATPAPPPPVSGSSAPPVPQPARRPEDDEEDPFGGTGNFMPYS